MEGSEYIIYLPPNSQFRAFALLSCVFKLFFIIQLLYSGQVKSVVRILMSGRLRLISKLVLVFKG